MQPCGRFCGLSRSYKKFLRGFPIICLADTIMILIRWVALPLLTSITFRQSWRVVVDERFKTVDDRDSSPHGNRSLTWWVSALCLILQVIKIFAIQNIPFTKAWTSMYLASLLITEVMSFSKSHYFRSNNNDPTPVSRSDMTGSQKQNLIAVIAMSSNLEIVVDCVAGVLHLLLCCWALTQCLVSWDGTTTAGESGGYFHLYMSLLILILSIATFVSLLAGLFTDGDDFGSRFTLVSDWLEKLMSEPLAAYSVSFYPISVCACFWWYATMYDSAGTSRPPWTKYLG